MANNWFVVRKKTIVLYFSSLLGVAFGVGVSVMTTRFVSPLEYGNYRYIFNILSFVSSLLLLGFFVSGSRLLAITNNLKRRREINGALMIILAITIIITIIIMLLLYVIHDYWLDKTVANLFIYAIPICFAPTLLNYVNTVFQGENRIYEISVARVVPAILYLLIGYLYFSNIQANAKIILLLHEGASVLVLLILLVGTKPVFSNLKANLNVLKKENKEYGFHVYEGSVLAVAFSYVSGITLGIFESDNAMVGYYTLALTIATPLSILPTIIGTTHFREFAQHDKIEKFVLKSTYIISTLSLLLFVMLISPVVNLLYSEDYHVIGTYACFLAVGTSVHGLGDMYNRFLGAHGKGKEIRNGAIACGAVMISGSIVLVFFFGIYGAIVTRILASIVYAYMMFFYYHKYVKALS